VNTNGGACLFPFYSTRDTGTESPVSPSYSTAADVELGTSFSSPLVAGVAALMLSVNSSLTPATLVARLKSSATPFPLVAGVPSCTSVATGNSVECNCTTTTCGAGMLNAASAVIEALRPIAAISSAATAKAGSSISLSGTGSVAADGHRIASYLWTSTSGTLSNADQASATLVASSTGSAAVTLKVTDDAGKADTASATISVTSGADGDLDGDGKVTAADALLVLRMAVQLDPVTAYGLAHGDMNGDGKLTAADALLVLRKAVGL
jgi:serine protease